MREWNLKAGDPLAMRFAADARLVQTDYIDDQTWEIAFGSGEEPALSFQTRYGGRAGLVRLVPMWVINGKAIYESASFAEAPALRSFAPNYGKVSAKPLQGLALTAELWVIDSHTVGGRFSMANEGQSPLRFQMELFAQIAREGSIIDMNLLALSDGSEALHMGSVGGLNPVLLLEGSTASARQPGERVSPRLSVDITLQPGEPKSVRWVHAGLNALEKSLQTAHHALHKIDWKAANRTLMAANETLPIVETGNSEWDAVIAFSNNLLLRSVISPAGKSKSLPNPSLVSARIPARGFSPHTDGTDHGWQWNGQTAAQCLLALPSLAIFAPELAESIFCNFLAVQQADGWIDYKPGMAGQRANLLCAPLLATTARLIYGYTRNQQFVEAVYPSLVRFFERWFAADMDRDQDGLPEWTNATQSGYPEHPLFSRSLRWAQGIDISTAEGPDLAAHLLNEASSLEFLAEILSIESAPHLEQQRKLAAHFAALWDQPSSSYRYRDRDTHLTPKGQTLFKGKGDESLNTATSLNPPNRLILKAIGGRDLMPNVSVVIEGVDAKGQHVSETVPTQSFVWTYGMGTAISQHAYSQLNYVKFDGLSRVYSVGIETVDLSRHFLPLLPLLLQSNADASHLPDLFKTLTDPARYWRPYGITVCPATDSVYAPNNENGSGGVWMFWNVLAIEWLCQHGFEAQAVDLFTRLMSAQTRALRQDRAFRAGYNTEIGEGIGDIDEMMGTMPLWVLMRLAGFTVQDERTVQVERNRSLLPHPIKVTQHGTEVERDAQHIRVTFASGHVLEVSGETVGALQDPTPSPVPETPAPPPVLPEIVPMGEIVYPTETDMVEFPGMSAVIPVESKKTDTLEIQIKQEHSDTPPPPDSPSGGITRIPVKDQD